MLCLLDRVNHTPTFDGVLFRVQDNVASTWVAIARLSHSSWIDEQAFFTDEYRLIQWRQKSFNCAMRVSRAVDDRHVRMAEQAMHGIEIGKVGGG